MSLLNNFRLGSEKENFETVSENIRTGVEFKGTNLWILIFAIFIASLGLNVNSTAVIIGAMLVSPLMGPIIGLGYGMAINDLSLLRKAFYAYVFAAVVSLTTSFIYFSLSPINEAHSEILARTSPNIFDVLIALFGGLAGILAISSKLKGNVIPGVAIATALMPPLCTAGYGLATAQFPFFFGALYLFLINTVFIALATLATVRFLKFPYKILPKKEDATKAKRIVWLVLAITVLPSIYFAFDMVQQNEYLKAANQFVDTEAIFPNDYLLSKEIDAKSKSITLTYGGQIITDSEIEGLKAKLAKHNLGSTKLQVHQGFSYLNKDETDEQLNSISIALNEKESKINFLQQKLDSLSIQTKVSSQIYKELKTLYPQMRSCVLQTAIRHTDSSQQVGWLAVMDANHKWAANEKAKIEQWLKVRLNVKQLDVYFE